MPRILIVTPAAPRSRQGNRVTAVRWAGLLRSLGYRVAIDESFDDQRCDVMIALHARKSAAALRRFRKLQPDKPVILALTGTDLYRDIHHNRTAWMSLELASRLVLLQPHGMEELPVELRPKARVIYQSAQPPQTIPQPLRKVFEVCVSGHLRPVKDPFRTAMAARRLPKTSRIHVTHLGAALSTAMARRARAEMARNSRYRWLGEVPGWQARRVTARSRLLVVSSKMEGGANVVSEALAVRTPVLSTAISGSIGLLGSDYPGYFPTGDTATLSQLLARCERDAPFLSQLKSACRRRAGRLSPERERAAWHKLIQELSE
ncbi:MAG: selenoneine biosynthesis selenosugar synthase SenB [Planctomycetaceae bacterium]